MYNSIITTVKSVSICVLSSTLFFIERGDMLALWVAYLFGTVSGANGNIGALSYKSQFANL